MSAFKEKLAERIRRWLPRLLPWWPIGLAWYEMWISRLATATGGCG